MRERYDRYSSVSILLHWAIFLLIVANIRVGGWMHDSEGEEGAYAFMVHKSLGLTVLALSLIRLVWRLTHRWPPLPDNMPMWERVLARFTHVGFYVAMIGVPLLGWMAVSSFGGEAVPLYGFIPLPDLPLPTDIDRGKALGDLHQLSITAIYALLVLHVLGALKHHFLNRDVVLHRMLPIFSDPSKRASGRD